MAIAIHVRAQGHLCRKQSELAEALTGRVREHHRFLIRTPSEQLEFLEQHLKQFDQRIEQWEHPTLEKAKGIEGCSQTLQESE